MLILIIKLTPFIKMFVYKRFYTSQQQKRTDSLKKNFLHQLIVVTKLIIQIKLLITKNIIVYIKIKM